MNRYEKIVAQLECKEPKHTYHITRIPVSEKAQRFFGVYEFDKWTKKNPNYPTLENIQASKRRRNSTEFQYIFYYDDPKQTEEERRQEAINHSIEAMLRFREEDLKLDEDYKLEVEKLEV